MPGNLTQAYAPIQQYSQLMHGFLTLVFFCSNMLCLHPGDTSCSQRFVDLRSALVKLQQFSQVMQGTLTLACMLLHVMPAIRQTQSAHSNQVTGSLVSAKQIATQPGLAGTLTLTYAPVVTPAIRRYRLLTAIR